MKLEVGKVYDICIGIMNTLVFIDESGEEVDEFWFFSIQINSLSILVVGKESTLKFNIEIDSGTYGWKLVSIEEGGISK